MRILTELGIILFSALICALFQLSLGTLLLLYHSSLGRFVRKKTKSLASSFISGVCLMNFLLLATNCFLSLALLEGVAENLIYSVSVGILFALALIILFIYFRSGKSARDSTELWLPKPISRFIDSRAKTTNSNSEAFSLGLLTSLGEFPFSFILFFLAGSEIVKLPSGYEILALSFFTIISVLPLIILRFVIRKGKNAVEIQRFRVKNKLFFKFLAGFCFIIFSAFILTFKLLGVGL